MLSTLYRMTVIIFLCLFSSACCIWGVGCIEPPPPRGWPPPKPDWAIDRVPTDEEGAIGCSRCIVTSRQENMATRVAIEKLARQKGVEVNSELIMQATESSTTANMVTIQGTQETIKFKTHRIWNHPGGIETCVWLKEIK